MVGSRAVNVVLPEGAFGSGEDAASMALRILTRALAAKGHAIGGGFLGGDDGYGADYENDVFMFHRYCWCEQEDCPWCAGCTCGPPGHYEIAGRTVSESEYQQYFDAYKAVPLGERQKPPAPWGVWPKDVHFVPDIKCRYCRGEFGNAPNFHHKASGVKVWWYKWIGRDMKIEGDARWEEILSDCVVSLELPRG